MSELLAFAQIGFRHIVSLDASDHILFLLALAAIYRGRDWRSALWVVSAFTIGHSITLALAVTDALVLPPRLVEFLIPMTIAITGAENLIHRNGPPSQTHAWYRPVFSGVFGLIHGAGFAGYLKSLFVTQLAVPLLGFNIGIELGQAVVLAGAAVVFWAADPALRAITSTVRRGDPFRLRLVSVSAAVLVVAMAMAVERFPS